ncbi:MAG: hypothetical protein ACFFD4_16095 [Candidatus Odinarchaeota archaeon]
MNTEDLLRISLEMADLKEIPADSAIYVPGKEVHQILAGIDLEVPEIMLAKQLGYDCCLVHHPVGGISRLQFPLVIRRQIDQMVYAGVPVHIAEKAVKHLVQRLEIALHPVNYDRVPSIARLLEMPFLNIHTPLDILGWRAFINDIKSLNRDAKVLDVVKALSNHGEMKNGLTEPKIVLGSPDNLAGKTWIAMAGGTNGGYEAAKAYFSYGVDTLVYMHISYDNLLKLKKENLSGNLILSGHIASDSVGINIYLKELEKRGVKVTRIGGIISP